MFSPLKSIIYDLSYSLDTPDNSLQFPDHHSWGGGNVKRRWNFCLSRIHGTKIDLRKRIPGFDLKEKSYQFERTDKPEDHLLDLRGLSAYSSLAIPTLRKYLKEGKLPYYKPNGKILVRRRDFDAYMETFRVDKREDFENLVDDAISALKY